MFVNLLFVYSNPIIKTAIRRSEPAEIFKSRSIAYELRYEQTTHFIDKLNWFIEDYNLIQTTG